MEKMINSYINGNGLYQKKLDILIKTNEKSVELTAINELYCLVNLLLNDNVKMYQIRLMIDKYQWLLPQYSLQIRKLFLSPSRNLAEWVFDYVIDDIYRKRGYIGTTSPFSPI
jgi:hypothetical protein